MILKIYTREIVTMYNALSLTITSGGFFPPCAMVLRTPSPIMPGKGVVYWNLQWLVPLGCVSYFAPLGEGELFSLHCAPVVVL